jgi:hypothetical protein
MRDAYPSQVLSDGIQADDRGDEVRQKLVRWHRCPQCLRLGHQPGEAATVCSYCKQAHEMVDDQAGFARQPGRVAIGPTDV